MVETGEKAPDFTVPLADGDIEPFTLSEHLGDGPIVLAFYPGAFTGTCTNEMQRFQEDLDSYASSGASVYGVSVDTPFSLNEFREKFDLEFGLLSDHQKQAIEAYDVSMDFADIGYHAVAKRSVFVLDEDGTITYKWVSDDPGVEPDYDTVQQAVAEAAK